MFNGRILVATDGSELSGKAAAVAVDLAKVVGAELVAFTALPVYPYAGIGESSGVAAQDHQGRAGAEASDRLARVERMAREAGVRRLGISLDTLRRWDRSELDQSPAYNPKVDELFGRRTDISPAMSGWSPRIGFNYRWGGGSGYGSGY